MAVRTLSTRKQAAPQQAATRPERRLPSLRTAVIAAAAYLIAVIFLLPYLEMLITAVRPQRELYEPNYLPHHFAWSNLTNMWGAAFGITSGVRVSLEIAAGATFVVLLIGTVLLVGALTFVPALALGPIVEHVMLWAHP